MLSLRSRAHLFALPFAISAAGWACSSDPDDSADGPDAGIAGESSTTGGTPSNGGSGGSGASGGGANGGGANAGGAANGGSSMTGGDGSGGEPPDPLGPADCSEPEGDVPDLTLTEIVGDLAGPISVDHIPGDDRLFIVLVGGVVQIFKDGQLLAEPFLDLGTKLTEGSERGLLGFAFHPSYQQNGLFYVHYSAGPSIEDAEQGDTIIEEYKVSSDPDKADAASARLVLTVPQPYANHNGGTITFGPDGFLYIGLGDGGSGGDPQGNGQDGDWLGAILRINPEQAGESAYSVPDGNYPGAEPEVFSIGLRNPFRFSFDACSGDLYIGDVGQDAWEEIDYLKAGEPGKNFGWNVMEGTHCFSPSSGCDQEGLTLPIAEHERSEARSITGGSVYRGSAIPALRGAYFYADYSNNRVWWLRVNRDSGEATAPVSVTQELNASSIVAIELGPDGELYFVSIGARGNAPGPGAVYRLEALE